MAQESSFQIFGSKWGSIARVLGGKPQSFTLLIVRANVPRWANCSPWRARGEKPSARNAAKQQIGSCGILPRRRGSARSHDIADTQGAIIDLHMFVAVGGKERSVSQYEHLLRQADLSMTVTTPLPSGYVLREATGQG